MEDILDRGYYKCTISRIPYGLSYTKKEFKYNGGTYSVGRGFYWILKTESGREIMDYFFMEYCPYYRYAKPIDYTRIKEICEQLNLESFNTKTMFDLVGKELFVFIDIRLNKDNIHRENYVKSYKLP